MARRSHNRRLRELNQRSTERGQRYIPGEEDVGPILTRIGFAIASTLVFVVLAAGATWFGSRQIERSVESEIVQLLRSGGYHDLEVFVDGRDVTVAGSVATEEEIELIPAVLITRESVRSVTAALRVIAPSDTGGPVASDPLTIAWDEGEVAVTGSVSTPEVRSEIITALEQYFAGYVDADGLELRPGVAAEVPWLDGVLNVFFEMGGVVDAGTIVVNPDALVVTVAAEYPDRQLRTEALRATEEYLALGGLDFVDGLTVEDAPPPPPREEVVELQEDLDDLIAGKVVEFEINSDQLTTVGTALLDEILAALEQFPDVPVEIAGHADASGTPEANLDLSQRRADAVLAYLVEAGSDPERFVVIGYGEERPIADNTTVEGRARNRRIEFIALDV